MGLTADELDYLHALGSYPHKVTVCRGAMEMARLIPEMDAWLAEREAVHRADIYVLKGFFLFLDPDVAMEFKLRFA